MSNFNLDENTINQLKDMMNKGEFNNVISKIPPEMIQNFSSMMQNNTSSNQNLNEKQEQDSHSKINSESKQNTPNNDSFDFSNIDMNTILKMKSIMEKMNQKNDPRANLLYSLKPYLREERKEKLDQYANLLNVAKFADLLKNDNKENPNA